MGELQKRISELEKQAITQWKSSQISPSAILAIVEEMQKEFPLPLSENDWRTEDETVPEIKEWFEKWLGGEK